MAGQFSAAANTEEVVGFVGARSVFVCIAASRVFFLKLFSVFPFPAAEVFFFLSILFYFKILFVCADGAVSIIPSTGLSGAVAARRAQSVPGRYPIYVLTVCLKWGGCF